MEGCVLKSLSYVKKSWDFFTLRNSDRLAGTFRWSEDPSIAWLVPSTAEDPACLKGFFTLLRELKIQRMNPGRGLRILKGAYRLVTSRLLYSHIWLNLLTDDLHFFYIFFLCMKPSLFGYKQKLLAKQCKP
jgi:hypothetical protein